MKNGAKVKATNKYGDTPLHLAAAEDATPLHNSADYLEIVQYLVKNKADINAKDIYERTPLHLAAMKGGKNIVKYLVGAGANINAINNTGQTPADLTNNKEIKEYLTKGMK